MTDASNPVAVRADCLGCDYFYAIVDDSSAWTLKTSDELRSGE